MSLTDPQFWGRSQTIMRSEQERDSSAQSRIILATFGLQMWSDHPLGIGAGNFPQTIGNYYAPYAGKDARTAPMCVASPSWEFKVLC